MIRARIWVDGRLAGGLPVLWGVTMAAYSGCGEGEGGQWWTGAVRLGVEWRANG